MESPREMRESTEIDDTTLILRMEYTYSVQHTPRFQRFDAHIYIYSILSLYV